MRVLSSAFLAATLAFGQAAFAPVFATESCTRPDDRAAFEIEGLKSQLMVTALACHQQDKYNAFMRRYLPSVASQEASLNGYFKRVYGKKYQASYDDYISNLANVQEQDGLKAGTAFCDILPDLFDEVMALHGASELDDFANSQAIAQPVAFETCTSAPTIPVKHSGHKARRGKTKHA